MEHEEEQVSDESSGSWGSFATRLVVAVLLVALPVVLLSVWLPMKVASDDRAADIERRLDARADAVALETEHWAAERTADVAALAAALETVLVSPDLGEDVAAADEETEQSAAAPPQGPPATEASKLTPLLDAFLADESYESAFLVDRGGAVLAATDPTEAYDPSGASWFRRALAGDVVIADPEPRRGRVRWPVAVGLTVEDGETGPAMLVVLLRPDGLAESLPSLRTIDRLQVTREGGADVVIGTGDGRLVLGPSAEGLGTGLGFESRLRAPGQRLPSVLVEAASSGDPGVVRFSDASAVDVVAGVAPIPSLDWVVSVGQDARLAYAPIPGLRWLGAITAALGIGVLGLAALVIARRESRPLRAFTDDVTRAGTKLRVQTHTLSGAADGLATASVAQAGHRTAIATAADDLIAVAGSLPLTGELVAAEAEAVDTALEESGDHLRDALAGTLVAAERAGELDDATARSDELARRIELLALNVAIEAAREGQSAPGVAAIADELRRLAERVTSATAELGGIARATRGDTAALPTVIRDAQVELERGRASLREVADGIARLQEGVQRQPDAIEQLRTALERTGETGDQVAAIAGEITAAAAAITGVAAELETAAQATGERF